MKNLTIALAISIVLGVAFFGISYPIFGNAQVSEALAAVPLIGSHHLAEALERQSARQSLVAGRPTAIFAFEGYTVAWPYLVAFGILIAAGITFISGFLSGVGLAFILPQSAFFAYPQIVVSVSLLVIIPATIAGGYIAGRWIGARTRSTLHGLVIVLAVSVMSAAINAVVNYLAIIWSGAAEALQMGEVNILDFAEGAGISLAAFLAGGLLGFWRGNRQKMTKYLSYLLSILPKDTGDLIVKLAYDEARGKTAAPAGAAAAAH
ncbi:hypothetical protein [Methyloceanibacter sp.]|uniref:hypothetical protein n=1 Tax=Methyloceanibacter sp. TaxID=1965321 RepID=UPI002D26DC0C|nr:hypothetical protein [Methyloceanibacter sp.]HZP08714.1 hypothetical protein [Methyloceanibacter sp.]